MSFYIIFACFLLFVLFGTITFDIYFRFQTSSTKIAAVSLGLSLFSLYLGGPVRLFRNVALINVIAVIEEVAITIILSKLHLNSRST